MYGRRKLVIISLWFLLAIFATPLTVQAAPVAANLISPSGTITTTTPVYTWNAVSNATWYYLWVSDSTGNKIQTWYTDSQAGCAAGAGICSVTPTITLNNGAGTWWLKTWNSSGIGPWSSGMSFYVSGNPTLVAATLISPIGYILTKTPIYKWNAVSNATWYKLWVNDSTGNKINTWYTASHAGCAAGTDTCSVTPSTSLSAADGTWWIQTWNSSGYGPWSSGMNFTVAIPDGAWVISQKIERDTPPSGFGAIVGWAVTATLKGGQPKAEKAFVTIDYWRFIEDTALGKKSIYEEHYDYSYRKTFTTGEAGLYVRYPTWFDPSSHDAHTTAFNMYAQDSYLYIDVSQTPDNIVHWWMQQRQPAQQGAKYSIEIKLKVEGKASVQLGADYWRDLNIGPNPDDTYTCTTASNNCEAWASDWIGDTGGQFITVTAPLR